MSSYPVTKVSSSSAGVGLKPQHLEAILSGRPQVGFFEVHAENYMGGGGAPHRDLTAIRELYPLSIHGVGLSIGGADELNEQHLGRLCSLVRRYEPVLVSEHLAWSSDGSHFLNDLLPVPYTHAALERVAEHIDRAQAALGREILLENPSTYLEFEESTIAETEFISELARRTGCALLLDVNNVYVSSTNHHRDAREYLSVFPMHRVKEIHLAGHAAHRAGNGRVMLIDSHNAQVAEPVWNLYREVLGRIGPVPTLIERDANIPPWGVLCSEAQRAQHLMTTLDSEAACAIAP